MLAPALVGTPAENLRSTLAAILNGYADAQREEFKDHPLAALIRQDFPEAIRRRVSDGGRYHVKGSPGNGNWAEVPWGAIFDSLITSTAQSGYYLVYLFRADQSGVYLSLNQGITSVKGQYGSGAHQALKARARDFQSRLGTASSGLVLGEIDLKSFDKSTLGSFYEAGAICSRFYAADALPPEEELVADFRRMMVLYGELVAREESLFSRADIEDDELGLDDEDAVTLREHKRIERNRGLAQRAKQHHGYQCKACGFDFEKEYGPIGRGYIEAHHLVPLSRLKGQIVSLSPQQDFTVLCANCHRMIHKTDVVGNVSEFRTRYVENRDTRD